MVTPTGAEGGNTVIWGREERAKKRGGAGKLGVAASQKREKAKGQFFQTRVFEETKAWDQVDKKKLKRPKPRPLGIVRARTVGGGKPEHDERFKERGQ